MAVIGSRALGQPSFRKCRCRFLLLPAAGIHLDQTDVERRKLTPITLTTDDPNNAIVNKVANLKIASDFINWENFAAVDVMKWSFKFPKTGLMTTLNKQRLVRDHHDITDVKLDWCLGFSFSIVTFLRILFLTSLFSVNRDLIFLVSDLWINFTHPLYTLLNKAATKQCHPWLLQRSRY